MLERERRYRANLGLTVYVVARNDEEAYAKTAKEVEEAVFEDYDFYDLDVEG